MLGRYISELASESFLCQTLVYTARQGSSEFIGSAGELTDRVVMVMNETTEVARSSQGASPARILFDVLVVGVVMSLFVYGLRKGHKCIERYVERRKER